MSSIARFPKSLCQGVAYKAENWNALSHEQYFSKHRFLDICQCAFNNSFRIKIQLVLISILTSIMNVSSDRDISVGFEKMTITPKIIHDDVNNSHSHFEEKICHTIDHLKEVSHKRADID